MPAGPCDKHQFKHTVAFNEGQVPKPTDEFVAWMLLFATLFPSLVPQPSYLFIFQHIWLWPIFFCTANISVFARFFFFLSFFLVSDASFALRQFYRKEVLKNHLLCGRIDISPLAWNSWSLYTLSLWFCPSFYYPFLVPIANIFHFPPVYFSSMKAMLFLGLPRKFSVTSFVQICWC